MAGIILAIGLMSCFYASTRLVAETVRLAVTHRREERAFRESQIRAERLADKKRQESPSVESQREGWVGWKTLVVRETKDEAEDCRSFVLEDPNGQSLPSFTPGQFIIVGVRQRDGKILSRCYSLSRTQGVSNQYRITVKRVAGGMVSQQLHHNVKVGSTLEVKAPRGKFIAPEDASVPLNLIAAGIGITPMVAMIQHYQLWQPSRPIRVFYQFRDLNHAPLLREVAQWAAQATHGHLWLYVSQHTGAKPPWITGIGHLSAIDILRQTQRLSRTPGDPTDTFERLGQFLICAPPTMIRTLVHDLTILGIPPGQITTETFGESSVPTESSAKPTSQVAKSANSSSAEGGKQVLQDSQVAIVKFARSEKKFAIRDQEQSLLDAAEAHGIEIESGCRHGDCGSCLVKVLEGLVEHRKPPGYSELGCNEALACIGYPRGEVVIDQ